MSKTFTILLALIHLLMVQAALAAQCKLVSSTCVDSGTKTINGVPVTQRADGRLKSPPQKIICEYRLHVQTERW